MRLLIVGSDETWSLEKHYRKHLAASLGTALDFFPLQSLFYRAYNKSVFHKLLFKAGLSGITGRLDTLARKKVLETQPSVIWVFKGMELRPSFFKWARSKGIKLVNYNPDNPFIFSGAGSGNKNVTASVGLFDLHLTYDYAVKERIETEYGIPCRILPFGFELSEELYYECTKQQEVPKLCFLGNPDAARVSFLEKIAEVLPVDVYGHNWSSFSSHPNITCHGPAYGDEYWRVLYRYRVQLNLMRKHNPGSHNMRSFEVPGIGGIGLFPDTVDHRTYFEQNREVFLYRTEIECIEMAKKIIDLHAGEASAIRINARRRSVESGYSYEARSRQVLEMFNNLPG
jgi:spore maturation protein CgeB